MGALNLKRHHGALNQGLAMLCSTPKPNPRATVRVPASLSAVFTALVLGGCGGDSALPPDAPVAAPAPAPIAPAPAPAPTPLSGSVAVGAPITDGRLRVLDATGAVVAADVLIAADGTYPAITPTGAAPWRLEACGHTGANYRCLYSVAQAAGTANVTPLTSAVMLLASGQTPESMMSGSATGLGASAVAAAQDTLRTSLAPVLGDAGVGNSLDLVTGALTAGSRTGYDRLLDAVGVSTRTDTRPLVQIVPRLGSGNLYIEQGSAAVGRLAVNSAAATLSLQGLETLFTRMTAAVRTTATCTDASTGMASLLSSSASLSMGQGGAFGGAAAVGQGLCMFLAGGGGEPSRLGSRFMSPVLGRCDFSGSAPVCAVSFALQGSDGAVEQVGNGMGVSFEAGSWKFKGDLHAVAVWAALPGLPWPNLSDSAKAALRAFVVPASSSADLAVSWGYTQGPVDVGEVTYCSDRALCGSGGAGRLADANLRPSATSTVLRVRTAGSAVEAGSCKMLALNGRTSDGMGLQSNHMSCPTVAAGLSCGN